MVIRTIVAHQVLGLTLSGSKYCRIKGVVLPVRGEVPVDSETLVVTSSISRFADPVFEDAHRGSVVCMRS